MNIDAIGNCILDESRSDGDLRSALDAFAALCAEVSDIHPDPGFSAWAGDTLLDTGVAINPHAAAHCVMDYQRSVTYIRGVYAALVELRQRFPGETIEVLYAGCGPYATLLLPLLARFQPGDLSVQMLDIHQRSLDSVHKLLTHMGFGHRAITTLQADACRYQHPGKLHLVIAETMQKSLEQEPQVAVTANLAPQLTPGGIFIPQAIEVSLWLTPSPIRQADDATAKQKLRQPMDPGYRLATVFTLLPSQIANKLNTAQCDARSCPTVLDPVTVLIPPLASLKQLTPTLITQITVFEDFTLGNYESEITLPMPCHGLPDLTEGDQLRVSYQLGSYPRFDYELVARTDCG